MIRRTGGSQERSTASRIRQSAGTQDEKKAANEFRAELEQVSGGNQG